MKLVIEIDLDHPDHDTAAAAFSGAMALLKASMDTGNVPQGADLREAFILAGLPDAEFFVFCEGGDPNDGTRATSRLMVMKTPFSPKIYSREQAEKRGLQMQTIQGCYEVDYTPETGFSVTDATDVTEH